MHNRSRLSFLPLWHITELNVFPVHYPVMSQYDKKKNKTENKKLVDGGLSNGIFQFKSYIWISTVSRVKSSKFYRIAQKPNSQFFLSNKSSTVKYRVWNSPSVRHIRIFWSNIIMVKVWSDVHLRRHLCKPCSSIPTSHNFFFCRQPQEGLNVNISCLRTFAQTTDAVVVFLGGQSPNLPLRVTTQISLWNIKLPFLFVVSTCKPLLYHYSIICWPLINMHPTHNGNRSVSLTSFVSQ